MTEYQSNIEVTLLNKWEGEVKQVNDKTFYATICDALDPGDEPFDVEIDISEVAETARPKLKELPCFYWTRESRKYADGRTEEIARFEFFEPPSPTEEDWKKAEIEADKMMSILKNLETDQA